MTSARPAAGPPSASGVRRGGDYFQDLIVWSAALELLRPGSVYHQLETESPGSGNVDDVVQRSHSAGDVFGQIKWATRPADPLDEKYLFKANPKGNSILQKLFATFEDLKAGGRTPTLRLLTNRTLDRNDPLLKHVDGRSELLMPFAANATAKSQAGRAVTRWAKHAGTSREGLLKMLCHLRFETGRAVNPERQYVRALMLAAGLSDDDDSIERALAEVASWVRDGKRTVTISDVNEVVERLNLRRRPPSAIWTVQAIDHDPHAGDATYSSNWVDLFDGDEPRVRVVPRDPAGWQQIETDIRSTAASLEADGWTSTLVRGAMRQATFFRVGIALPRTRQHELHYVQGDQSWSTDAAKPQLMAPTVTTYELGRGSDIAVAVGLSLDPSAEVRSYLTAQNAPVRRLITITPSGGADDQSVASAGHAVAYAEQIRNAARAAVAESEACDRVHLFLAGPGGLALLLGHRWNRTAPTQVYEHVGPGRGYTPAFLVNA